MSLGVGLETSVYATKALALLVERLARFERPCVLDLGPLSGQNVNFLAGDLGYLVRVEDLSREGQGDLDLAAARLALPRQRFQGVLLWSLLDHLSPEGVTDLVDKLFAALSPGGLMLAFFGQRPTPRAKILQHNILNLETISPRETPLEAPCRLWPNREILNLFNRFDILNSFILKTGLREMIVRRPTALALSLESA